MNGIGTIVNILAVLVGGGFGVLLKGRMKVRYQQILSQTVGLLLIGVGGYAFINAYFLMTGTDIETDGVFLVIFALVCGLALGIALNMEKILTNWGKHLSQNAEKDREADDKRRRKLQADLQKAAEKGTPRPQIPLLDRVDVYEMPSVRSGNLYADGFVAATLMVCTNAMLFSGVYEDCLNGDTTQLFVKSVIDLVLCFVLAFIYGGGVLYAAVPLIAIEGGLTLLFLIANYAPTLGLSDFLFNLVTPTFQSQMSLISGVLLMGTGVCLAFDKKFKVANLFPAYLIPVVYEAVKLYLDSLVEK